MFPLQENPACWERFANFSENTDRSEDLEMTGREEEKASIIDKTYKNYKTYSTSLSFDDIKDDITCIVKQSNVVNGSIIKSKLFEVEDVK